MSKQGKRKITVELPKTKDLSNRPSVFERLGTKKTASVKKTTEHCRQWAQHGNCAYGKSCKFAATHTLISPSKQRAANKDSEQKRLVKDDGKNRLHSTVVVRSGRSPDGEIDNWDQNDLEYADTDVLEKRRQQLQRELELQMKMDCSKDMRKDKKKVVSSTSSSRSSSSSSISSSSSDGSTSSSSSGREARRKGKKGKLKRNSSSSSEGDVPSKKKFIKTDPKRDKSEKKGTPKKDDRLKKSEIPKKKPATKPALGKKSLSPGKKSGGTPPITSKSLSKNTAKHGKSPQRRERNRSVSPRDRDKERDRSNKDKDREKERDKDRDRARGRSRSPRKGRSRSPRPHPKDLRKKESSERSRPVSPKKQVRRDGSSERHRKRSASRDRDRGRDHKDRSLERRKDKHDDKDRHDRKDRGRDRNKESKRDDKRRGRDRGLGNRGGADKGLEKPNKPMERLLPRPEERLAALAAISNRVLEPDKSSTNSKDRQDAHSERGGRKQDRIDRDRSSKRDRIESVDREQGDYEMGIDRQYDNERSMEHYDRVDDRYEGGPREDDRSPGYGIQGRDRHYDAAYDMPGPARGYPDDDDRMYGDHIGDHRGVDIGYDDRRPHRDHSWEGRSGSMDRERGYMHPHKDWDNDDYRSADWGRERHWPMHEPQMSEWGDKDAEMEGWHHRGHPPGPHRNRMHEDYGRGMRMDVGRGDGNKRRMPRNDPDPPSKNTPPPAQSATVTSRPEADVDDKPIPDDLSEISDDPDDILNREDMADQTMDEDSQTALPDEGTSKVEGSEKDSTQDTSGAGEEKESQEAKDEEDVANLDFEEISDGELEEERTRAGLGDALGVDWASLVADVRRREQTAPTGGARDRWKPERVLTRLGLSIDMAGKETVQNILKKNAETMQAEKKPPVEKQDNAEQSDSVEQNGQHDEGREEPEASTIDIDSLHPVAAIQVAIQKRKRQRAVLFGTGCEITRGLSARRDLALRRYLCHLPVAERTGQSRVAPQPALFHAARALLMQAPVTG
ncbi:zinc finger CCCH domain-containing protein 13-like isoform X1 [Ostrinia furnacalis]|uniref:zinc finger CCCH domain-containing protein 13-like isoform X1 n=1 Tax=Ostrinia furnacalis TaxID=93504 RepID=UPI00103F64AE|nr:zinc finger CCCH domain-containing protein 13-like isoform X1 [Ostrinia furnacalis]